jgi:hypothetical protein
MAHNAMNSRVEPEVICGPLSLRASRIGRAGSSQVRSTVPSRRAATCSISPSPSRASQKAAWTWVEVSSTETTSASHLRETRSSIAQTATPARVKWVVSKIHSIPGLYSTQSGNGWRTLRAGRGSGRSRRPSASRTRRTLDGDTQTLLR